MKTPYPILARWLLLLLCAALLTACPTTKKRRLFYASCGIAADCASNLCVSGVCSKSCTTSLECGEGVCVQQACLPVERVQCSGDTYCADLLAGRPCVSGTCAAGKCQSTAVADGTVCSAGEDIACEAASCSSGRCLVTTGAKNCDDGVACTTDSCAAKVGCVHAPTASLCPAGAACTEPVCDAKTGCSAVASIGACDDGNPCTTGDTCATGSCVGAPRGPYQAQLGTELLRPKALAVSGDAVLVLSDATTGPNLLRLQFVAAATGAVTATQTFGDAKSVAVDVAAVAGNTPTAFAAYVDAGGPKVALVTPTSVQQVGLGNLVSVTGVAVLDQTAFVLGTLASGEAAVQRLQLPSLAALGTTALGLAPKSVAAALLPLSADQVLVGGQQPATSGGTDAVAMVARASLLGSGSVLWTAEVGSGNGSQRVYDLAGNGNNWLATVSSADGDGAELHLGQVDGSTGNPVPVATGDSAAAAGDFAVAASLDGWAAAGGQSPVLVALSATLSKRGEQAAKTGATVLRTVDVSALATSSGSWVLATTAATSTQGGQVWLLRATDHANTDCTTANCTALAACNDAKACSRDTCNPASGCAFVPEDSGIPCDDGNPCSSNDVCGDNSSCSGDLMRWSEQGDLATTANAVVAGDGQIYLLLEEVSGLGPTVALKSLTASGKELWQKMVQVTGEGTGWALAGDGSYVYVAWRDGPEATGTAQLGIWSDSGEAGPVVSAGAGNRVLGLAISGDSLWTVGDGPGTSGSKAQVVRRKRSDLTAEVTVSGGLGVSIDETLWAGAVAADGTLVAVGSVRKTAAAQADGWIVRVSPVGAVVKTTQLSHAEGADVLYAITPLPLSGGDAGFVAAGERTTAAGKRMWVVRLTAHGEVLWDKAVEPATPGFQETSARAVVALTGAGGPASASLLVLGHANNKEAMAMALDPFGNPMASQSYGLGMLLGGASWSGDRWIAVGQAGSFQDPLQGKWLAQMTDIWLQASCDETDCLGTSPAECDDNNPCTTNFCVADKCVVVPLPPGFVCGDGDGCQTSPLCGSSGGTSTCGTSGPKTCSDNNPCTSDSCDATDGCVFAPVSDGSPCSGGQCQAGQCQ